MSNGKRRPERKPKASSSATNADLGVHDLDSIFDGVEMMVPQHEQDDPDKRATTDPSADAVGTGKSAS
ncbi:hypothetical protein ASE49_10900 [Novosphingobium sp. Leaf2]|nr:hypothetical protein ASE49_10900 [Novosphingobium sp. Leaf2]